MGEIWPKKKSAGCPSIIEGSVSTNQPEPSHATTLAPRLTTAAFSFGPDEFDTRVPFLVRGPGLAPGSTIHSPGGNVDVSAAPKQSRVLLCGAASLGLNELFGCLVWML